jgi:hypothetical protein
MKQEVVESICEDTESGDFFKGIERDAQLIEYYKHASFFEDKDLQRLSDGLLTV